MPIDFKELYKKLIEFWNKYDSKEITSEQLREYFNVDEIYVDQNGNETGDSISLIPCDYELDSVNVYKWEELFDEEVSIQIYDEY